MLRHFDGVAETGVHARQYEQPRGRVPTVGEQAEAEALQRQTLELKNEVLGDDHPSTLDSMNNFAVVFRQQDKQAEAEGGY